MFTLIMDLLLVGGFIAISILMRGSTRSKCGNVGYSSNIRSGSNNLPGTLYALGLERRLRPRVMCRLDKAVFGIAVATA
jgi:hypothetical protein